MLPDPLYDQEDQQAAAELTAQEERLVKRLMNADLEEYQAMNVVGLFLNDEFLDDVAEYRKLFKAVTDL